MRKILILQHNCNRSDIAMHSCLQTAETTADIVIIQGPWIGTNNDGQNYFSISHPSFLMLMSPTTHCPRTLTYVSNFGAEVWWNQQKTQSLPFQRLQNQAMRKIAGAFKTTPIASLEAELGLPPADLRLDRIQSAYKSEDR